MQMGRPRKAGNRDLPANLYRNRGGWRYVHPVTGKITYFPATTSREAAAHAAAQLNSILQPTGRDLVSRVLGEGQTVRDAINEFRAEELPNRGWGPKTLSERKIRLARIEKDIGGSDLSAFGVQQVADYLKSVTKSPSARAQYRYVLSLVFTEACQRGWVEQNPVLMTKKPHQERKRARLTMEGFQKVYQAASPWLRNAMDLGLLTLQRRADIVAWRFADVRDGWLHTVPGKTEATTNVRLKIQATKEMLAVVERCRDKVLSPFLIHRLPEKARPQHMKAKLRGHHTQVLPAQLSREFDAAREASGAFDGIDNPPTFHEIRSLGADRYRQMGWPKARIQALLGHSTEGMTSHYLEGHEAPWTEVILA